MSKDTPVQRIKVAGEYYVLMPFEEYEALSKAAKAHSLQFFVPKDVNTVMDGAPIRVDGETQLKAWRNHRGLTQKELATMVGIGTSHLNLVENGLRQGRPAMWRSLAEALNASIEDILPNT